MNRRQAMSALGALPLSWALRVSASTATIEVFKSATCGCCTAWVKHMQAAGFTVKATNVADPGDVRASRGMPDRYASCHTALVGGYVVEGHVPAADVSRLLAQRPAALGLAVPGMPSGAPGMEGGRSQPFDVVLVETGGTSRVYAHYAPR
jgi:hypothetical protein